MRHIRIGNMHKIDIDKIQGFNVGTITDQDGEFEIDPTMAIPETMEMLDHIQKTIEHICDKHDLDELTPLGIEPVSKGIDSWLNVARDILSNQFGKSMLDANRFAADNNIDTT